MKKLSLLTVIAGMAMMISCSKDSEQITPPPPMQVEKKPTFKQLESTTPWYGEPSTINAKVTNATNFSIISSEGLVATDSISPAGEFSYTTSALTAEKYYTVIIKGPGGLIKDSLLAVKPYDQFTTLTCKDGGEWFDISFKFRDLSNPTVWYPGALDTRIYRYLPNGGLVAIANGVELAVLGGWKHISADSLSIGVDNVWYIKSQTATQRELVQTKPILFSNEPKIAEAVIVSKKKTQ